MTILLTGGLGFIGSHIFVELAQSHDVVIVDNLFNSNYDQIEKLEKLTGKKPKVYVIDMLNQTALETVFTENKITNVIHLAGLKSVAESIQEPLFYYSHNLQILFNLLNTMKKYDCKNLVFSSSATVYGNSDTCALTEEMQTGINLTNPYGKSKYFQEEVLKDLYHADRSYNITLLRYFNPAGNHPSGIIKEEPKGIPANLFPCIMRSIKENTQLKIYGNIYKTHDGTCIRDFIHVVDLAKAHVAVLACTGLNIYNVGTGIQTSVLDVITTFECVNDMKLDYIIAPPREGDCPIVYADCSKIYREVGWKAKFGLEDICNGLCLSVNGSNTIH